MDDGEGMIVGKRNGLVGGRAKGEKEIETTIIKQTIKNNLQ